MTSLVATPGRRRSGTGEGFHLTPEPQSLSTLLADVWRSRNLIGILGRRSFFTRYRRASFGLAWAVLLPLVQATVMALVFHFAIRIRTPHYAVFIFAGMFPWSFFNSAVTTGSTAIVDNSGLSSRIYFPRIVLPIVSVTGGIYNFLATIVVLLAAAAVLGVYPGLHTLLLVPGVVLAVALAVAFSAVLSALQVYFRDIRYIVVAATTAWFYITPIFYPLSFLPAHHAPAALAAIVKANPATGVVELFRAAIVHPDPSWVSEVGIACGWTVGLLGLGLWLHRRFDRLFADLL